jgi:hypothetical protein
MSIIIAKGFLLTSVSLGFPRICANRLTGTVTASTEADGYPASRADNVFTYGGWQPTSTTSTWEIDLGGSHYADYCGIVGQYNNAAISVQYYNGAWNTIDEVVPANNEPLLFLFSKKYGSKFRLSITGAIPTLSVIKFGVADTVDRGVQTGFAPSAWNRKTEYVTTFSEGGQILSRNKKRSGSKQKITIPDIPESWANDNWRSLRLELEDEGVFFAWNPAAQPNHITYGMTDKDPNLTYSSYSGFLTLDIDLIAI